ncbi:MAG: UPF0182 family protein [Planctomycetaceae bacterium]
MSTIRIGARPRRWPLIVVGTIVLLAIVFTALSGFVIDLLWYREIGQRGVFLTTLWTKAFLAVTFGVLFTVLLYVNLLIARRLRPTTRALTPDQEVLERIRDLSEPFLRWMIPLGAVLLGLLVGLGVMSRWQTFLLWRNSSGVTFGYTEPQFDRDAAFYVFTLPWLRFLQGWLFSALVGVTVLAALAHVLWGGIRPQAPLFADKATPAARAHLSVLLGLIMLVKAWGYYLGRFDLLTSSRGVVQGASYTDVHAQLPALNFLAIVAVICAILFFLNIRLRQWSLPVIAVGLLALVSVLLGAIYPAFVQSFRVKPNEQAYETPYIDRNIAATRTAFGLDKIQEQQRDPAGPLTAKQIADNKATVSNIRLWRGVPILQENFQNLQRYRQYYDFNDVDVDRYPINGKERVLMIAAREIHQDGLTPSAQTWQNMHLAYTHGYGAVAAEVNTAGAQGQPVFTLQNLPPVGEPSLSEQRIYYGESNDVPYVVTGTTTNELDYQGSPESTPYTGGGGIPIGNIFTRALFAWNFKDYNLLVSGAITGDSRILINRDIQTRVQKAVPFLGFDSDPYFAVVGGEPTWIWDAYTYTNQFPYSQSVNVADATDGLLAGTVNYLRNAVKVEVNAYTGQITYYADLSEPIVQVWNRAFPGLFTDINQAPTDLVAHFRYPENLLQVQAYQYANYHVTNATAFYQKRDFWQIPEDPTRSSAEVAAANPKLRPYYQLIRLPGESTEQFQLVLPFVPQDRQNMVGWMAASSDPGHYGDITVYRFPEGRNIDGPSQVFARINQDPQFSAQRTLLDQAGSTVLFGDFLVIPIDDSFLYVEPVYVRSNQTASIPELLTVAIVNGSGGNVVLANNLQTALQEAVQGQIGGGGGQQAGGGGSVDQRVQRLLAEAATHFQNAQTALTNGDLGTYQTEIEAAQQAVAQAQQLLGTGGGGSGTGASPSAPPSSPATAPPTVAPSAAASASPSA